MDSHNDDARRLVASGLRDAETIYKTLLGILAAIDRATYVLGGVTRSTSNEAPGRALGNLQRVRDEVEQALRALAASSEVAEQWVNSGKSES